MKRNHLMAALIAAGFSIGAVHAQQSDPTNPDQAIPDPANASMGEATAEQDKAYDDRVNIEGPEERLHGQRDGDMEGERGDLRADQLEKAPANPGGASQSSAEQPQIPDQSLGSVGHPAQADTTGQGSGVDEQPASAERSDESKAATQPK